MKVKILKDMGYKEGEIIEVKEGTSYDVRSVYLAISRGMTLGEAIEKGFAEEVKDEIDIEEIRRLIKLDLVTAPIPNISNRVGIKCLDSEAEWFTAYRTVKSVIEKLNGDWKPNWQDFDQVKWELGYSNKESKFSGISTNHWHYSIMPYVPDKETAEKVIALCEPELKVLFNVN